MERGDNHSVTPYWHLQPNMQAMFDKALIQSTLHSNWRRCSNKFFPSVLNATNCLGSFFHLLSTWMLILSKIHSKHCQTPCTCLQPLRRAAQAPFFRVALLAAAGGCWHRLCRHKAECRGLAADWDISSETGGHRQ